MHQKACLADTSEPEGFDRQTFFLTHPESYPAYSTPCRMTSPSVVGSAGDAKTRCATLWDSSNGSTSRFCITIRSHAGCSGQPAHATSSTRQRYRTQPSAGRNAGLFAISPKLRVEKESCL